MLPSPSAPDSTLPLSMLSPAVPLSQHLLLLLFHPLLHCSSLLHAPSRSRYRVARTSMHRCALSRARSAFAHIRTQSRIEHRLPALTGRVQRSLGSHRLALSRPGRSAWSTSRSFSPSLSLSLFLHTRSRTEYRHVSRTPRHHRHFVSRSVSSCLSSFPSLVLLPSFSPTYRFLLLLYSPSLPPFLRHTFPPLSLLSVILRRSPLFLSFSLRFPHRRQCRAQRSRAAMRTTQMHASDCTTLDVNGLAREKKRVRRSVCERIAGVTDDSLR